MMHEFLKKWGRFALACVLYIITGIFMYVVQYKLFGNVIKTPLMYVVVFPVFALLGWVLNGGYPKAGGEDEKGGEELLKSGIYTKPEDGKAAPRLLRRRPIAEFIQKWQGGVWSAGKKISFIVSGFILVAATIFMFYALFIDPYTLNIYLYFGILIMIGLFCFYSPSEKRPLSAMACLLFVGIIVIIVIYLAVAAPMTVRQGKDILSSQGYENVNYEKSAASTEVLGIIFDNEPELLSSNASGLGFYVFRCEKGGEQLGAALSVTDKNVVAVEPVDNESGLSFFLNFE